MDELDLNKIFSRPIYYIENLKGEIIPADIMQWGTWFNNFRNRRVGLTKLKSGVTISTVFLGIDHGYSQDGPPLIFETMIFGGHADDYQERYYTRAEATAGHERAVKYAMAWWPRFRHWFKWAILRIRPKD